MRYVVEVTVLSEVDAENVEDAEAEALAGLHTGTWTRITWTAVRSAPTSSE